MGQNYHGAREFCSWGLWHTFRPADVVPTAWEERRVMGDQTEPRFVTEVDLEWLVGRLAGDQEALTEFYEGLTKRVFRLSVEVDDRKTLKRHQVELLQELNTYLRSWVVSYRLEELESWKSSGASDKPHPDSGVYDGDDLAAHLGLR